MKYPLILAGLLLVGCTKATDPAPTSPTHGRTAQAQIDAEDEPSDGAPRQKKKKAKRKAKSFDKSKVSPVLLSEMMPLLGDPRFNAMIKERTKQGKSSEEATSEVTTMLFQTGVRVLGLAELDMLRSAKLRLAQTSLDMCSAQWTGDADRDEVFAMLNKLPEADQRNWYRPLVKIALRTLDKAPIPPVDETAAAEGIAQIHQGLPPDQQLLFMEAVSAGEDATPAQGCFALKALLQNASGLEPGLRERFLREMLGSE